MSRRSPRVPTYDDSPLPARDSRVRGEQLLALAVIRSALTDARPGHDYRADALRFLSDADGALGFWIRVLGCDEREVRALIAGALNGKNPNKTGPKRDIIGVGHGAINTGTDP